MNLLPWDMIDEILRRIPVKPLLRFRCVSRGWCARIDSKDFAKKQLKTSLELNFGAGLLIEGDGKFVLTNLDSLEDESPVLVEIDGPLKDLLSTAVIVGASNGLMCVYDSSGDYFVLNPITRKIRKIPRVPPEFPKKSENNVSYLDGFGYDEVNDDFKLVRIAQLIIPVISLFTMVYSLKNNAWTPIQDVPGDDIIFDRFSGGNMGVCGSGSLHWVFKQVFKQWDFRSRRKDVIVSFDLTVQQFKNVPYPPTNYPPNKYAWRILDKFGEYLCIKDYHHDVVDLWVMNFPGAERTWYKALSKEAHGYGEGYSGVHSDRMTEDPSVHMHNYRFLAFSRSGEVLVERQSHLHTLRLLFWDKLDHRNRMSTIRQIRIPEFHVRLISFVYTESLLHLTEDEDDPLQQKPSIHKQKKNHEKNIRDDLMSAGFSLRL